MNAIESTLADALHHGRDMAGLAGRLRDKLKAGVADMQAILDETEAFVDASVAKAREGLSAFKDKVAEIEGEMKGDEAEIARDVASERPAEPGSVSDGAYVASEPEMGAGGAPGASVAAVQAVMVDTGAPIEHVEPAVQAHAAEVAAGSPPEVAQVSAQAAAASAGASPEVAVAIAESVATQPAE